MAQRAGWHSNHDEAIVDAPLNDCGSCAHDAICSHLPQMDDAGPEADVGPITDPSSSTERRSRREVREMPHDAFVFNDCAGVQDHPSPHAGLCVHDHPGHRDGARAQCGGGRYPSGRVNERADPVACAFELLLETLSEPVVAQAQRNEPRRLLEEPVGRADHWPAKDDGSSRQAVVHEPFDAVPAVERYLCDDASMATCSYDEDGRVSHSVSLKPLRVV